MEEGFTGETSFLRPNVPFPPGRSCKGPLGLSRAGGGPVTGASVPCCIQMRFSIQANYSLFVRVWGPPWPCATWVQGAIPLPQKTAPWSQESLEV